MNTYYNALDKATLNNINCENVLQPSKKKNVNSLCIWGWKLLWECTSTIWIWKLLRKYFNQGKKRWILCVWEVENSLQFCCRTVLEDIWVMIRSIWEFYAYKRSNMDLIASYDISVDYRFMELNGRSLRKLSDQRRLRGWYGHARTWTYARTWT